MDILSQIDSEWPRKPAKAILGIMTVLPSGEVLTRLGCHSCKGTGKGIVPGCPTCGVGEHCWDCLGTGYHDVPACPRCFLPDYNKVQENEWKLPAFADTYKQSGTMFCECQ